MQPFWKGKVTGMKVLLVNGSPHEHGCTDTALREMTKVFENRGIESQIFWTGRKPLSGCIACGTCREKKACVFDDCVNEFLQLAEEADGFVFGSPVHYAAASGAITSFMDRVFYANSMGGRNCFRLKPAAAVISARRAGTTATLDQLNKYFTISEMPVVSSVYWNMVHGASPEEVLKDREGIQTIQILADNMAYLLSCFKAAHEAGVRQPDKKERIYTNFIRV